MLEASSKGGGGGGCERAGARPRLSGMPGRAERNRGRTREGRAGGRSRAGRRSRAAAAAEAEAAPARTAGLAAAAALLVLAGAALAVSGCSLRGSAKVAPRAAPVSVAAAARGDIRVLAAVSARVEAAADVPIVAKAAGRVSKVAAGVGDRVNEGDLLIQLDSEEISLQAKQAEAAYQAAKANLATRPRAGS